MLSFVDCVILFLPIWKVQVGYMKSWTCVPSTYLNHFCSCGRNPFKGADLVCWRGLSRYINSVFPFDIAGILCKVDFNPTNRHPSYPSSQWRHNYPLSEPMGWTHDLVALVAEQEMLMFLHVYQMHSGRRGQSFVKLLRCIWSSVKDCTRRIFGLLIFFFKCVLCIKQPCFIWTNELREQCIAWCLENRLEGCYGDTSFWLQLPPMITRWRY